MHLAALKCRGFRNLVDATIELERGVVLFCGPNGAGKTNFLEAVYFCLTGISFRSGQDRDVIRFGESSARVEAVLSGGAGADAAAGSVLVAAIDRGGDRRHRLDDSPVSGKTAGRPLVSVFHPDRLQLVKGPPARRRAHLDRLAAALWPSRADTRLRFGRTLAQRNALVGRVRAGQAQPDSLGVWDERLAAEAEPLAAARDEAVDKLQGHFSGFGSALGVEGLEMTYRPRAPMTAGDLAKELAARRARDLGRAYLTYGPQLDEVELRLSGRALRRFGSQGQQRLALLALLFAERVVLIEAGRPPPLMLLDDVMSELDPSHRSLLVSALGDCGQTLLTATEAEQVPVERGAQRIAVRGGAAAPSAVSGDAARGPRLTPWESAAA